MSSRRKFLSEVALAGAAFASADPELLSSETPAACAVAALVSMCGKWRFQTDPENAGTKAGWHATDFSAPNWHEVVVPHTWQVDPAYSDFRGVAWYRRTFDALQDWRDAAVRLEFEAVFHTATVWVNGQLVGEHSRKGYTAFSFDITSALRWDQPNVLAVRVDGAFNEHMLPRGRSSDWAHDGGIFRPVHLIVTPKTFIESVHVEAVPNLNTGIAAITISAHCRNTGAAAFGGTAAYRIIDDDTGLTAQAGTHATKLIVKPAASELLTLRIELPGAKLWHFDSPHLYRLEFRITDGRQDHQFETTFGVRSFEVQDGKFHLNGEPVRLMGVERLAGSNPQFGMAETDAWIARDHDDLKKLNCVFTRVHWPQDKRVLDYCDRHGILMQLEVPAWGPDTFKGMTAQPDSDIMENGLEQLREMIQSDGNHPSVVAWGLCNEIDGQNPPAYEFAKRLLEEAKRLDPRRLCSYASHSLRETPEKDVAGLMDFIEANEYFSTWHSGNIHDLDKHLDSLHAVFPGKPIVISEYGYCACTPDRPEGDSHRIDILRTHDEVFRSKAFVSGAIFFCYNDYRTHVGDRGTGALQQRVHGVVDLYGARKPSYDVLRHELSPIESLTIENRLNSFHLLLKSRTTVPAYTLRGYKLRAVFYGQGDIPVEVQEASLPELPPGQTAETNLTFAQSEVPRCVRFEVIRHTSFPAFSMEWNP